jgi:hypothetical protein
LWKDCENIFLLVVKCRGQFGGESDANSTLQQIGTLQNDFLFRSFVLRTFPSRIWPANLL